MLDLGRKRPVSDSAWLLRLLFSSLSPFVGTQERHLACKNYSNYPQKFSLSRDPVHHDVDDQQV